MKLSFINNPWKTKLIVDQLTIRCRINKWKVLFSWVLTSSTIDGDVNGVRKSPGCTIGLCEKTVSLKYSLMNSVPFADMKTFDTISEEL